MKLFSILFLLPALSLAADLETTRASILKIISKVSTTNAELRGSGVLFSKDSKFYVLTSDHVVIHSNDNGAFHSAVNSVTGQKLRVKYLAQEWGLGLALLEVVKPPADLKAIAFLDLIKPNNVEIGSTTSFYGYPYESDDLIEETNAKLLSKDTALPYFVLAPKLYELDAQIGEFGMSGGGAFGKDGSFLGILAYQRILIPENRENRVYTIPPSLATTWLEEYFKKTDKYVPVFNEPWWGQGQPGITALLNANHYFIFKVYGSEVRMMAATKMIIEKFLPSPEQPSLLWEDSRSLLKGLRADLDNDPIRPCEFSLIDRSGTEPTLVKAKYAAEVFTTLNQKNISLFIGRGEQHELRYARLKPIADQLSKEVSALNTKMASHSEKEWTDLSTKLKAFVERLDAVPPQPNEPGPAGANEFFASQWLATTYLLIETHQKLSGWALAEKSAAPEAKLVRETLTKLGTSLNVLEVMGTN